MSKLLSLFIIGAFLYFENVGVGSVSATSPVMINQNTSSTHTDDTISNKNDASKITSSSNSVTKHRDSELLQKDIHMLPPVAGEKPELTRDLISSERNDRLSDDENKASKFDGKAVQRALIVITGLTFIVLAYLGVKLIWRKRRKPSHEVSSPNHLYNPLNSSEMTLLQSALDDTEDEDTLFDIPPSTHT